MAESLLFIRPTCSESVVAIARRPGPRDWGLNRPQMADVLATAVGEWLECSPRNQRRRSDCCCHGSHGLFPRFYSFIYSLTRMRTTPRRREGSTRGPFGAAWPAPLAARGGGDAIASCDGDPATGHQELRPGGAEQPSPCLVVPGQGRWGEDSALMHERGEGLATHSPGDRQNDTRSSISGGACRRLRGRILFSSS